MKMTNGISKDNKIFYEKSDDKSLFSCFNNFIDVLFISNPKINVFLVDFMLVFLLISFHFLLLLFYFKFDKQNLSTKHYIWYLIFYIITLYIVFIS